MRDSGQPMSNKCRAFPNALLANDLGRLVRTVGHAVVPLDGVTVSVELGGAPRLVDVGGGAGAVRDVLGGAGRRVVAVIEGEDAQLSVFCEARCNQNGGWKTFLMMASQQTRCRVFH